MVDNWAAVPPLLVGLLEDPAKLQTLHKKVLSWWRRYRMGLEELAAQIVNSDDAHKTASDNEDALRSTANEESRATIDGFFARLKIAPIDGAEEAKETQVLYPVAFVEAARVLTHRCKHRL